MHKDVAVVIGVGGMGQAIARRVGSGRKVLLADFNEATLTAAADVLRGEGHDVATQIVDVSDHDSVTALAATAGGLGQVSRVAHTAGLSQAQASTEAIMRVDLVGVALMLEEFEHVIAPGGAGVVIASMAGHLVQNSPEDQDKALSTTPARELLTLPFLAADVVGVSTVAYMVAKRANILRVQAAAGAWGARGARINSISPGVISTPMARDELASATGDGMRAMVDMTPAKRMGTPDDIAAAAAFLLDPQAGFITGTDLLVDGGAVATLRAMALAG